MRFGPAAYAASSTVLGLASAILVNLITSGWSWPLAAFLGGVSVASGLLLWIDRRTATPAGTRVSVTATRGGKVIRSGVRASRGAQVDQRATDAGEIDRSPVRASGAAGNQTADGGTISESPLDLRE
ncbi:hypothetical protein AB0H83_09140 [Dactylosporangium sp. NPDC050688]|uniref:hypothetical protein n=1 Tax=Dactylosporangium sp. NPDC050688 TaxID=3157217 RepID=UPI003406817E